MPKVILFDLGGVIFRDIYSGGCADFASLIGLPEKRVLEVYAATDVPEWTEGKISDEARWKLFADKLGLAESSIKLCAENFNIVFKPIPEVVDLLESLHVSGKFKLGVLSDQHPGAVRYLYQSQRKVMDLFDPSLVFISSHVGFSKHEPNNKFFQYAIGHSGVAANEILFVDDSLRNVTNASKAAMMTYFFDRNGHTIVDLVVGLRALLA